MVTKIQQFIEKNINLINENHWEEIYNKLNNSNEISPLNVGEFTLHMLSCNINPLLYLTYVPKHFLSYARELSHIYKIQKFEIPDYIKKIDSYAFFDSGLTDIYLPSHLEIVNHKGIYNSYYHEITRLHAKDIQYISKIKWEYNHPLFDSITNTPFYINGNRIKVESKLTEEAILTATKSYVDGLNNAISAHLISSEELTKNLNNFIEIMNK